MNETSTAELLEEIREAATRGGDASIFISEAYLSWYWSGDDWKVNLHGYAGLDRRNRRIFHEMLDLRHRRGWCDEDLCELARELASHL